MPNSIRSRVAESETLADREKRRESTGRSSGESYVAALSIVPDARCEMVRPVEEGERLEHSTISITLDLYSHVMPGMQEDGASKVDATMRAAINRLAREDA